jgi:putative transposase
MAVTARGGVDAVNGTGWRSDESQRVVLHTDRGSTYTAASFTGLCRRLGVRQSMGRVGSCLLTG